MNVEPSCLQCDCMSFIEHNGYPMTYLDFTQYVVHMMSRRVQNNIWKIWIRTE